MSAAEWLDRVDALAREATEGPWGRFHTHNGSVQMICPDTDWYERQPVTDVVLATVGNEADAEFVAAARDAVPAMSAALRAVLDLHRTTTVGTCRACWTTDWAEQGLTIFSRPTPILAPCPTVRAITEALT